MWTNESYIGYFKASFHLAALAAMGMMAYVHWHPFYITWENPNAIVPSPYESARYSTLSVLSLLLVAYIVLVAMNVVAKKNVRISGLVCCGYYCIAVAVSHCARCSLYMINKSSDGTSPQPQIVDVKDGFVP